MYRFNAFNISCVFSGFIPPQINYVNINLLAFS